MKHVNLSIFFYLGNNWGVSWRGNFISQLYSHQSGTLLLSWSHRGFHKLQNERKKNKMRTWSRKHIVDYVLSSGDINESDGNEQGGGSSIIWYNFNSP